MGVLIVNATQASNPEIKAALERLARETGGRVAAIRADHRAGYWAAYRLTVSSHSDEELEEVWSGMAPKPAPPPSGPASAPPMLGDRRLVPVMDLEKLPTGSKWSLYADEHGTPYLSTPNGGIGEVQPHDLANFPDRGGMLARWMQRLVEWQRSERAAAAAPAAVKAAATALSRWRRGM